VVEGAEAGGFCWGADSGGFGWGGEPAWLSAN